MQALSSSYATSAISVLTEEALTIWHELQQSSANLIAPVGTNLKPSHMVLNWHSNALKDLAERQLLLLQ